MGIVARSYNKSKTKAAAAETWDTSIGPWLDSGPASEILTRDHLITLAELSCLWRVEIGRARSVGPLTDGKYTDLQLNLLSMPSTIRLDGWLAKGDLIKFGAWFDFDQFGRDWALRAATDVDNRVNIFVDDYREREGAIPNMAVMQRVGSALSDAFRIGPSLTVRDGFPSLDALVSSVVVDSKRSSLPHEYIAPLPAGVRDELIIQLPGATESILDEAADKMGGLFKSTVEFCREFDFGGGVLEHAVAQLWTTPGDCKLTVRAPGLASLGHIPAQRCVRALLTVVWRLTRRMPENEPARVSLQRFLDDATRASTEIVADGLLWTGDEPFDAVCPVAGMQVPVAILVDGPADTLAECLMLSGSWSALRCRVLEEKSRWGAKQSRVLAGAFSPYNERNADGKLVHALEFGVTTTTLGAISADKSQASRSWKIFGETWRKNDGSYRTALFPTSSAVTQGVLAHGTDLLAVLRAFAVLAEARPSTESVRTVMMTI